MRLVECGTGGYTGTGGECVNLVDNEIVSIVDIEIVSIIPHIFFFFFFLWAGKTNPQTNIQHMSPWQRDKHAAYERQAPAKM